jgi:GNAT superfamily N-acetyltransferase
MDGNQPEFESERDGFLVSTDKTKLDIGVIHGFLSRSYWARNIPISVVERSIENSLCFGVYDGRKQVGFARVITDHATFAYLADVFILEEYRGRGLSRWMLDCIMSHPDLQGLRRWLLATRDAQGLYHKVGFGPLNAPDRWMEIRKSDPYG